MNKTSMDTRMTKAEQAQAAELDAIEAARKAMQARCFAEALAVRATALRAAVAAAPAAATSHVLDSYDDLCVRERRRTRMVMRLPGGVRR